MNDDGLFDEHIAATYDADSAYMFAPEVLDPAVDFLADLASGRRALEFAIGTGRVGLALQERGVDVTGIELSRAMAAKLAEKPGGDRIPVTIGDMASTRVDGTFGLVYLVFNTISNLLTQDEQVECFRNAAAHLDTDGHFVIEVGVPSLQRLPEGETFRAFDASGNHIGIDEYDLVNQRLISHHYWNEDGKARTFDSHHRYVWPAEYDLMARIAGMELQERWADWRRSPFEGTSTSHVSVWTKVG